MTNKHPVCKFKKSPQGLDENKSKGQVNLSIENNLIKTLRTRINEINLIDDVVNGVKKEASNGYYKNAIKLLEIAKEPESNTTVNINQAVQVNKKDIDEAVNIINELR
jgi:hypothetical protein